ncbi:hypothetical protein [Halostagnicola sp. A-GB9-2]|nr:hypothetical protein [Halostagnicola sp. A-GB9-2]MDJ1430636.1 hypothetical protein [Halostagnicola sp. A-GB9-2]
MTALTHLLLEAEPALPMTIVGWGVLLVSLLIAVVWLAFLYR